MTKKSHISSTIDQADEKVVTTTSPGKKSVVRKNCANISTLTQKITRRDTLESIKRFIDTNPIQDQHTTQDLLKALVKYKTRTSPMQHLLPVYYNRENHYWKKRLDLLHLLFQSGLIFNQENSNAPTEYSLIALALDNVEFWGLDQPYLIEFIKLSKAIGEDFKNFPGKTTNAVTIFVKIIIDYHWSMSGCKTGLEFTYLRSSWDPSKTTSHKRPERVNNKISQKFMPIAELIDEIETDDLQAIGYYSNLLYDLLEKKVIPVILHNSNFSL